jgi:metal-dependent amidase/aminoacylase/carboxypeptidase family protein
VKATSGRVDHNASKSEGVNALSQIEPITTKLETKIAPREMPQSDTARDDKSAASEEKLEKSAQNAVESSTMLKSRAAALSQDRREQAMRRLRERAKAKKMAAGV